MPVKWNGIKTFLFSNHSFQQTVVKNTFWLTAGNLTGRLIKAALIIYVARVLGAEGYGVFSYAVGLAGFFSIFSDIGLSGILTREASRNPENLPEYLGTSLGLKTALLAFTGALILGAGPQFFGNVPEALPLLPLAALLIISDSLRDLTFSIARAAEKMQTEAGISIFTNFAITVLGIGAVLIAPTPLMLMGGYTLGSVVATLAAFWVFRAHFRAPWKYFRKNLVVPILKDAAPLGLLGIAAGLMLNTDTLMVGWLTPAEKAAGTLGVYAAAQRPIFVLYMVPSILSTVLFPALARAAQKDRVRARAILERGMAFSFLLAVPLVAGGLAVAQSLVLLLFGAEYAAATTCFMVLLLTLLIVFPGGIVVNAVLAYDIQKTFLWSLLLGTISNFVLDYFLIPVYGIVGSAIATIIAQFFVNGVAWMKLRQAQEFHVLRHVRRIVPASLCMAALTFALDRAGFPVLASVGIGGVAYLALLVLFREPLLSHVPFLGKRIRATV